MIDLATRIGRLEDVEAIRALKARYSGLADAKYTADHQRQPQDILDRLAWQQALCFSEDAVWHGGTDFGSSIKGRTALYEWFRASPWRFALHIYASPQITLDGDEASARWVLWEVATTAEGDQPVFLAGATDETYRRTAEGWLQTSIRFHIAFTTPFDGPGWATLRNVFASESGASGIPTKRKTG